MNDLLVSERAGVAVRPTWVRYQVLAAACLLALIAYIHRVGFAPAGTYLKRDLGLTDGEWGLVMAAFLAAYALFEIPWGVVGDSFGARHLITLMTLGWSVLTAIIGLVDLVPPSLWLGVSLPFGLLFALRFVFGAFQAGAFPALSRVMTDWMPITERGTAQGLIWMCSRMGGFIAPFLMVALIGWCGLNTSFALVSILGLVWCVAFWPWFRNRPEDMRQVNDAERMVIRAGRNPEVLVAHHHDLRWSALFRSRSVWFLCLMYGCGGFSGNFFITLLPSYLRDHRGLSPEAMQWLSGLPLGFGVFACLGGGLISDWIIRSTGNRKWGRRITGMCGSILAGSCLLATNWVADVWVLGVLLSLTFFGNDLNMGPAWASCADIAERNAGTLGGTMNMMANLAGALAAVLAGQLLGKTFLVGGFTVLGNELVFWVFGSIYFAQSLCWLGVDVTRRLST